MNLGAWSALTNRNGLVSNYAVAPGNLCDQQQWVPALEAHVERFGRAPRLAAADRGFWNSANEKAAARLGVKQVVLPGRGRLSPTGLRDRNSAGFGVAKAGEQASKRG